MNEEPTRSPGIKEIAAALKATIGKWLARRGGGLAET